MSTNANVDDRICFIDWHRCLYRDSTVVQYCKDCWAKNNCYEVVRNE